MSFRYVSYDHDTRLWHVIREIDNKTEERSVEGWPELETAQSHAQDEDLDWKSWKWDQQKRKVK